MATSRRFAVPRENGSGCDRQNLGATIASAVPAVAGIRGFRLHPATVQFVPASLFETDALKARFKEYYSEPLRNDPCFQEIVATRRRDRQSVSKSWYGCTERDDLRARLSIIRSRSRGRRPRLRSSMSRCRRLPIAEGYPCSRFADLDSSADPPDFCRLFFQACIQNLNFFLLSRDCCSEVLAFLHDPRL